MAFKIAIDTGPLKSEHKVRGVGMHTNELIESLKKLKDPNFSFDYVDFGQTNLNNYDLVHYQFFHPHRNLLPESFPDAKVLVTVHDLIPLRYPDRYPPGYSGKIMMMKQKARLKRADGVITISETSKKDITSYLGIKTTKISVVHLAASSLYKTASEELMQETTKKFGLPNKFVLFVGDINYNKNVATLVKACKAINVPLVLVGKHATEIESMGLNLPSVEGPRDWIRFLFDIPHPELAHFKELLTEIESSNKIIRTGFITEEEKGALLKLATVYCQPSFYEGFGLPVLEAMSVGTPVICSTTPALKEVAGKAALYFDPKSEKELAKVLAKVIKSPKTRKELSERGLKRVEKFSWEKTAKATLSTYAKILQ